MGSDISVTGWVTVQRTVNSIGDLRKLLADLDALGASDDKLVECDRGTVWATVADSADEGSFLAAKDARGLTLTRDSDIPTYDWPTRDRLQGKDR
jgi:hypothetical protein